jgi:hypothetical protein
MGEVLFVQFICFLDKRHLSYICISGSYAVNATKSASGLGHG